MNTKHRLLAIFVVLLSLGTVCFTNPPAFAGDGKQQGQAVQSEQQSADSSSDTSSSVDEVTGTQPDQTTETHHANSEDLSLLSIAGGMGLAWFEIVAVLGFLAVGHVLAPAAVWHLSKVAQGGAKPKVG